MFIGKIRQLLIVRVNPLRCSNHLYSLKKKKINKKKQQKNIYSKYHKKKRLNYKQDINFN